jgi:hypothetical protein
MLVDVLQTQHDGAETYLMQLRRTQPNNHSTHLASMWFIVNQISTYQAQPNSQRQQMQVMPPIVMGPGTTGSVKIGRTTLNTSPQQTIIAQLIRKIQGSPTAAAPVVSIDRRGDVAINGMLLSPADPTQAELIKIIKSEIRGLAP